MNDPSKADLAAEVNELREQLEEKESEIDKMAESQQSLLPDQPPPDSRFLISPVAERATRVASSVADVAKEEGRHPEHLKDDAKSVAGEMTNQGKSEADSVAKDAKHKAGEVDSGRSKLSTRAVTKATCLLSEF